MGIKFGDIDASQILENEFRVEVLEGVIDWLLQHGGVQNKLTEEDLQEIKERAVKKLQKKYPNSGIGLKEK